MNFFRNLSLYRLFFSFFFSKCQLYTHTWRGCKCHTACYTVKNYKILEENYSYYFYMVRWRPRRRSKSQFRLTHFAFVAISYFVSSALIYPDFSSILMSCLSWCVVYPDVSSILMSRLSWCLIYSYVSSILMSHLFWCLIYPDVSSILMSRLHWCLIYSYFSSILIYNLSWSLMFPNVSSILMSHLS